MSTLVEVYRVESSNATGEFIGFGSLLDPRLVFLHPHASRGEEIQVARSGADAPSTDPARCRIRSGDTLLTLDGYILATRRGPGMAPTVVQLDLKFTGQIDSVPLPFSVSRTEEEQAEEVAGAVMAFLSEAARSDPATAGPAPEGPDVQLDDAPGMPGKRPWYCVICPGAKGC